MSDYGYAKANDPSNGIRKMRFSYRLNKRTGARKSKG